MKLWFYSRSKKSFKYNAKLLGNTEANGILKNAKIAVLFKYLGNLGDLSKCDGLIAK